MWRSLKRRGVPVYIILIFFILGLFIQLSYFYIINRVKLPNVTATEERVFSTNVSIYTEDIDERNVEVVEESIIWPPTPIMKVPELIRQETPTTKFVKTNKKQTKYSRYVLLNCGAMIPNNIKLFRQIYPNAVSYQMYSFVADPSYRSLFKLFPNHTTISAEASIIDVSTGSDVGKTKVDLARWIFENTNRSDFVILKIKSSEEHVILKRLIDTEAIDNVDKYYTEAHDKDYNDYIKSLLIKTSLRVYEWFSEKNELSDFDALYSDQTKGKIITTCRIGPNEDVFKLLLYASQPTKRAILTLYAISEMFTKEHTPLSVFLPFEMFEGDWDSVKDLAKTFSIGMYYDPNIGRENSLDEFIYIRNRAIGVRNLCTVNGTGINMMLVSKNATSTIMDKLSKLGFSIMTPGVDVTHLSHKVMQGQNVELSDLGLKTNRMLMVDLSDPNAEYLLTNLYTRFQLNIENVDACMRNN